MSDVLSCCNNKLPSVADREATPALNSQLSSRHTTQHPVFGYSPGRQVVSVSSNLLALPFPPPQLIPGLVHSVRRSIDLTAAESARSHSRTPCKVPSTVRAMISTNAGEIPPSVVKLVIRLEGTDLVRASGLPGPQPRPPTLFSVFVIRLLMSLLLITRLRLRVVLGCRRRSLVDRWRGRVRQDCALLGSCIG
jgi:hypothetical protein